MTTPDRDTKRWMARALRLARKGLYTTDPNPRVGCVVVRDGKVVGEGWHRRAGEPHAEVYALRQAGEAARGATAYVTLEPCSHHGRTPPCADALVAAGVAHVKIGMRDPNPCVDGGGIARLRAAGVSVESEILANDARALNPGFAKRMEQGLPWVRVKLAASLDGRTAMASGESVWITGDAARRDVQFWRARASCILSGSGTVLHDDPALNVRLSAQELGIDGQVRQPVRVVLDSRSRVPSSARVMQGDGDILLYTTAEKTNINNGSCEVVNLAYNSGDDAVDLPDLLRDLAKRGMNEVHLEAGATLCGALLSQALVDEIVLYTAPHLMGDSAKPLFHLPHLHSMRDRLSLTIQDLRRVGNDIRLVLRPQYP